MRVQTSLILGILFALVVAAFAVANVDPVTVNYFFGKSEWPLIIVIISSVFMGGIIIGSVGFFRIYTLQKEMKLLKEKNTLLEQTASEIEEKPQLVNNEKTNKVKETAKLQTDNITPKENANKVDQE